MAINTISITPLTGSNVAGAFTDNWTAVNVVNHSGSDIYVTTNGQPVTSQTQDGVDFIPSGGSAVLSNELGSWSQAQSVMQLGPNNQWGQSLMGQVANPGTSINVWGATGGTVTGQVQVEGCG